MSEKAEKVVSLRLDQLEAASGGWNRPMETEGAELEVLEASMMREGQLEPIVVRPVAKGRYEVISGHRRLAAARKLNWATLEARVREMSDEDAESWGFATNFARKNIGIFWEAVEVQKLKEKGESVEQIVAALGHSDAWVRRRLLLNLEACKRFAKAVLEPTGVPIEKVHPTNLEFLGEVNEKTWEWLESLKKRGADQLSRNLAEAGWLLRSIYSSFARVEGRPWSCAWKRGGREEPACADCLHYGGELQVLFPELEPIRWVKGMCGQAECVKWKQACALAAAKEAIKKCGWKGRVVLASKAPGGFSSWKRLKNEKTAEIAIIEDYDGAGMECGEWGYYRKIQALPKETEPGTSGTPGLSWQERQRVEEEQNAKLSGLMAEVLKEGIPASVDGVELPGSVFEALKAFRRWVRRELEYPFYYFQEGPLARNFGVLARIVVGAERAEAIEKQLVELAKEFEIEFEWEDDEAEEDVEDAPDTAAEAKGDEEPAEEKAEK